MWPQPGRAVDDREPGDLVGIPELRNRGAVNGIGTPGQTQDTAGQDCRRRVKPPERDRHGRLSVVVIPV
ncbi:Uncharacterised protein [Mycobacteroides abscessus subsp. abscessus]|nr:Uncharacterised protein [Mycobacteroides abscessus subsp. abscessus]